MMIALSRVTPQTALETPGLTLSALYYIQCFLGHMRPPFMDYDGCGSSQILAYFPNYTTFLCKKYSSLMAASPNF